MENNSMRARNCINLICRELDELYVQKRDDKDTISLLQEEVRILREEKEVLELSSDFLNDRLAHANQNYTHSILQMYWACALAFISTGFLVWNF